MNPLYHQEKYKKEKAEKGKQEYRVVKITIRSVCLF